MREICLSGSMSGDRKQDQAKPDCGGAAKASSNNHRATTVTAPVLDSTCAVKGAGLQRVKLPPGNWCAPPGSNRSGGGGNKPVGAFDGKGRLATRRACRP